MSLHGVRVSLPRHVFISHSFLFQTEVVVMTALVVLEVYQIVEVQSRRIQSRWLNRQPQQLYHLLFNVWAQK